MITSKDQLNQSITLTKIPKRIISLVPSQTEYLYDLGLNESVVGITKFCIHPNSWFKSKVRVGGTKQYHFDRINDLNPDLIIGNKEENDKTQIELLQQKYPVWMSDIHTFEEAISMMKNIGELVDKTEVANGIIKQIKAKKKQFEEKRDCLLKQSKRIKAAYFIWQKPFMVAANNTYINEMLQIFGVQNVVEDLQRYPIIELEDLKYKNLDYIFLSSEPFPFKQKHIDELQVHFPATKIIIVDGEMFSWYGTRMLKAFDYFEKLLLKISK